MEQRSFHFEAGTGRRYLPGAEPSLLGRARAWVVRCVLAAIGAVILIPALLFGAVALVVAIGVVLAGLIVGAVAYLVLRHRLKKRFAATGQQGFFGAQPPFVSDGRQNVRVIVHPPGEQV